MKYNFISLYIAICQLGLTFCGNYSMKATFTGACEQTRYMVGGFYKAVAKTVAPTVVGEETAMSEIFSAGYEGSEHITLSQAAVTFKDEEDVSLKLNPYLTVFVSAVSAGMNTITNCADLTQGIKNVLATLTDAVNDRLELLQQYTDRHIMNVESQLIERDIKFLFLLWANCRKKPTKEAFRACQDQAYSTIDASMGNFALFYEKMDPVDDMSLTSLNRNEMKRMEVNLMAYRTYVVLNVLVLKSMIESENNTDFKRTYEDELKGKTVFFELYAMKAVDAIDEYYKNFQFTCTSNDINCDDHERTIQGGPNRRVLYTGECRCVLVADFFPQKCHMAIDMFDAVVADPKYERKLKFSSNTDEAIKEFATEKFEEKQNAYREALTGKVFEFWQGELLKTVTCANKLAHGLSCDYTKTKMKIAKDAKDDKYTNDDKDDKDVGDASYGKDAWDGKDGKNPKNPKNPKDAKDAKDDKEVNNPVGAEHPKDVKDAKDTKDSKNPKDAKEAKDPSSGLPKYPKERPNDNEVMNAVDAKVAKDAKVAEAKDPVGAMSPKEVMDAVDAKVAKDVKKNNDNVANEAKEAKVVMDAVDAKVAKDAKDAKDTKDAKDAQYAKDTKDAKDAQYAKDFLDAKRAKNAKDAKDAKHARDAKDNRELSKKIKQILTT